MEQEFKTHNKYNKIIAVGMAVAGFSLVASGTFAALNDTLTHDETVTIEWVDIVDDSSTNLALEDVADTNNTPVEELIPGVTYELTGVLENDSTVITNWTATNLTSTPGINVTISDADGDNPPTAVGEDIDVAQFGITVQLDDNISPSTPVNLVIEFSSIDARGTIIEQPTAISDVFSDPALAACVASDDENGANGDVNYVISQEELNNITSLNCESNGIASIEGIQYIHNLETFISTYGTIDDLTPLTMLTNLTFVDLRYNNIVDITALANLTNLTTLKLSGNYIIDLTPLSDLTSLTYLIVGNNNITDVSALANLTNLTILGINDNEISDISALANLTNLTSLNMGHCQISDISSLSNMDQLTELYIDNNAIYDFSPLAYQPTNFNATNQTPAMLADAELGEANPISIVGINDQALNITFNTAGSYNDGQLIWQSTGLNSLNYISNDGKISGTINQNATPQQLDQPTPINIVFPDPALAACIANDDNSPASGDVTYLISQEELNNYTDLNCHTQGISNITGLEYLTNLVDLRLHENQISDIAPIANLKNLEYLELHTNLITDISAVTNLTNLTFIQLGRNEISDITPLANLTNLTHLYLNDNNITDVSSLANLTKLQRLGLARNEISDISALANMTELTMLDLNSNQVSDISALNDMTKLTNLYLQKNQITDFSPITFEPAVFEGMGNNITLPNTTLSTPTDIIIDGVNGEDLIITFNTPGTYENGQLTWQNPGTNSLTYKSTDGKITGTITQQVN